MKKSRTLKVSFKMTTCKSQKPRTELVAIYRLEFYKKQKNWKLSSPYSKKSSKKPVDRKNDLNTTYKIEESSETKEPSDPLNVAFVDFNSDQIQAQKVRSDLSVPKKHELSQQWLEPVNIWPDVINNNVLQGNKNVPCVVKTNNVPLQNVKMTKSEGYVAKPERYRTMQRLQQLLKAAQLQEHQDNIQNILKESMIQPQSSENNVTKWNYNKEDNEGNRQYYFGQDSWLMPAEELLDAERMRQDFWSGDKVMSNQSEDAVYSAAWFPKRVSYFDSTPWATDVVDSEDWCELSVDSIGEFIRGADAAPHSSELDLTLPSDVDVADVSFTALSRLSSRQLALAARLHSRVLRRLLLESEQRQRLHHAAELPSSSEYSSVEEFPTRDVGPGPQQVLQRNVYTDAFVAGSHLQPGTELLTSSLRSGGRGRGRLV